MDMTYAVGWALLIILTFAGVIIALNKLEEWVDREDGKEYSEYHDEHTENTNR